MTSYDEASALFTHSSYVESGLDQAMESFAQALTLRQLALGRLHALTAAAESDCGVAAGLAGLPERAERHHRAALEARQELFGSESEETAASHHNLGGALEATGDVEAAAEAYADALAVRRRLSKEGLDDTAAESAAALGRLKADAGDETAAAALFREALNVYRHTLGDHPKTADLVMSLTLALLGVGEEEEGERLYQEVGGCVHLSPPFQQLNLSILESVLEGYLEWLRVVTGTHHGLKLSKFCGGQV
mmetsp:Transcript_36284/g.89385  ORF Transcript_36284/g.89385 Transcript_36284/m.89385 type:complete len:249 (+) Transcript_36284:239-985(+)